MVESTWGLAHFGSELYDTIHGITQFGPKTGLAPVVDSEQKVPYLRFHRNQNVFSYAAESVYDYVIVYDVHGHILLRFLLYSVIVITTFWHFERF